MAPKAAPKAGGKKGPPNAMIAKLKMALDRQREEEERLQREAEEEEARLREEERLAEEQRKIEEEEKKMERERQKEEQKALKKANKKGNSAMTLDRMRAAGFILPDIEKIRQESKDPKPVVPKPAPKPAPVAAVHVDPSATAADVPKPVEEVRAPVEHVLEKVSNLRSPICCVLGHVDTGKTSLLDRIRSTNVQGGEAGGITQQIGATFFPREALVSATLEVNKKYNHKLDVPGLLVIDTPGHESFTNLRSRGSSLCDIAILVVDIMHGLEQQTKESIKLLREKKCPFIVALNKVDRLYGWEPHENMDIEQSLSLQKPYVRSEFDTRLSNIKLEFSEQGLNSELYWTNKDVKRFVSIVPTSARTGEGVCDLLLLQIQLTQQFMEGKVTYKDDLQCTVLEVKPIQGIGFTIDVVLINGELHEGDQICVCGANGAIFTQIRALLTPQPLREMRVRGDYVHHKKIRAAMGIKISANDLEYTIPGTPLLLVPANSDKNDRERLAKEVMKEANNLLASVDKSGEGVTVQSSTLGSLEALLQFLKDMKIPVANVAIGPMHKRHMLQVQAMREKNPKFAVVLAFDVQVMPEAYDIAEEHKIKIFEARIIYHLFDKFTEYVEQYDQQQRDAARSTAVFPVHLKIVQCFRQANPIVMGVHVQAGTLHPFTPLCYLGDDKRPHYIGKIESIQKDEKDVKKGKTGEDYAIKINTTETNVTFGRQINGSTVLMSQITRASVDAIKLFKSEMTADDTALLKKLMQIQGVAQKKPAPKKAGEEGKETAADE